MFVKDLKADILPQAFLDCLPKVCPFCGGATEITEGLTALSCSNPMCKSKLSERMVAMLLDLGVKNLGPAKCVGFIEDKNPDSPYALFAWANKDGTASNPVCDSCSLEFSHTIAAQLNDKRDKLLWEYVRIGNLPGIRDSARQLVDGYDNIENFYDDLESGEYAFVANRLGIQYDPDAPSIKTVEVYNTLMAAKEELCHYVQYFNIFSVAKSINICISTGVGKPYTSKADFVDKMNKKYGAKVHINQLSSVTKQCAVLVWSKQGAPTSKVQKAKKNDIPVITGRAFDILMEAYVNGKDLANACAIIEQAEDTGVLQDYKSIEASLK